MMASVLDKLGEWIWQWRRPRPRGLPLTAISLSDQELAWEAFETARQALIQSKGNYKRKVRLLPTQWRFVYLLLKLDAEVKNGGFHQFFTNASGAYDSYLAQDVDRLQNTAFKDLISRAVDLYRGIDYTDQWDNVGKSWDYFAAAYKEGCFEGEDTEYYSIKPDLDEVVGKHVREHLQDYQNAEPNAPGNSRHGSQSNSL